MKKHNNEQAAAPSPLNVEGQIHEENLKVIYLKSELKSFSWNDGLFAIQKEKNGILHLWKIKDGKLHTYSDGSPVICCTGVNNKGIHPTDLTTAAPSLLKENEQLKELLKWVVNEVETTPDDLSDALLGLIKIKCNKALSQTETKVN